MLKPLISPRFISFIVCLLMSLAITPAFAKAFFEEGDEPLEIESNAADFQEKTGNFTHTGRVLVRQGDRYLFADRLVIHRDQEGKIDKITANGQPTRFEVKSTSEQAPIYGEANTIKYFAKENKIVLLDQAQLKQEERVIRGPHLTYYPDRRVLSSESVNGQQTKVILNNKGK